jgi:uncharacterized protein (DUF885 family)
LSHALSIVHSALCIALNRMHWRLGIVLCCAFVSSCRGSSEPRALAPEPEDARVRAFADAYLAGYLNRFPETATYYGIPGQPHDRLADNSPAALARWHAQEDAWLGHVRAIDTARISSGPLEATHAIVLEAIESAIASRVCRNELWNVSQMTGWHVNLGYVATIQPVGTDRARQEALARWGSLPKYVDVEIANLREGLKRGYTAPRHIVRIVIDQVRTLASTPAAESPFLTPARSDKTPEFVKALGELTANHIVPAVRRYADFLEREYLPAARDAIAVASHPEGAVCYGAAVRAFSTLPKSAKEVHELGLREVARIDAEMKTIAERSFGTGDVPALMQRLRTDRKYLFRSRKELIGYSMAAVDRARAAAPQWFGLLPKADVRIEPYPAYREKNAPGEYNPPSEDGSRPALFYISAYEAEKKSRADNESTAFHETIPGHHLQTAIALERKDIHPIGRYLYNSGYAEGWALYSEELADEMTLFSGDLDRLGMLGSQNWRAVRLVVDSGMHAYGWTRQQAIDYMLAHTTANENDAAAEIDRYIIWPGQATSYMLGRLEILAAREEARKVVGAGFDIKAFHDRVLEDGSVPLTFLRQKIRAWSREAAMKPAK